MDLTAAIEAFNESSQPPINLQTKRDGRVNAVLPRVGREILVTGSPFNKDVQVRAMDVALLCEEARRAIASGMALLEAALGSLNDSPDGPAE